jgi:flagellar biosynthesis protein FlhF
MFVKSYIAKEMPEAMERIRKELGPDAVLLSSRQIKGKGFFGMFGKKLVEVTVAYEPTPGKTIIPERRAERLESSQAGDKKPAQGAAQTDGKEKFSELVQQKSDAFAEAAKKAPSERKQAGKATACPENLYNRLLEREMHISLAKSIAEQTGDIISKYDDDPFEVAENIIMDMIGAPGCIKLKKYRMNILMLLGPTGVGKTTTIVKLAGQFALEQGLKVGFINTDTYRVAAQEQLKTYAEIMELPISQSIRRMRWSKRLLTLQGWGRRAHRYGREMQRAIRSIMKR